MNENGIVNISELCKIGSSWLCFLMMRQERGLVALLYVWQPVDVSHWLLFPKKVEVIRIKSDGSKVIKTWFLKGDMRVFFFSKSAFSIHALMLILTETRQLLHFQPIAGQKITGVGSWGWKKRGGDRQSSLTWNILPCKFVFQYLPLPFDDLTTQELNARKPSA